MRFAIWTFVMTLAFTAAARADVVSLIDETFTSGSASGLTWTSSASGVSNGQQWTWSSPPQDCVPTATEVWTGTGGASARGLATTYDDDQNSSTPNVNIPGGVEVMSSFNETGPNDPDGGLPDSLQVAVQVTLPTTLDYSVDGLLTFFAANRLSGGFGGNTPRIAVYDITDGRSILASTAVTYPGGNSNWNYKSYALALTAADAGDTIEIRFSDNILGGGGGGARGLEFADVNLSVNSIPTPAALPAGLALLALGAVRRRRA